MTVTDPAKKALDAKPVAAFKGKIPAAAVGQKVGSYTETLLVFGLSTDETVAALNAAFPDKANSVSNVNWYKNKLRKEGKLASGK